MLMFFSPKYALGLTVRGCLIKNHAGAYLPLRSYRWGEVVVTVCDKLRLALCGQSCGSYG